MQPPGRLQLLPSASSPSPVIKNAAGAVAFLRGQRQPHRNRQTVAQRAGVELDARRFLPHRVAGEMGIGMLVGLQPLDREEAGFRQDAVVAATAWPFDWM